MQNLVESGVWLGAFFGSFGIRGRGAFAWTLCLGFLFAAAALPATAADEHTIPMLLPPIVYLCPASR